MLDKLWDDVVAGPRPETGLEKLRKATTARPLVINKGSTATRPGATTARSGEMDGQ
ncbi:Dormancy-associated protein 1 isoform 2 [Zea mays]|uniref:Auxin-repressed 12.5 kDa protein n=1 Tax=Zea mays TaxID=4577 RepID=B6SKM1_MAIZE|nr:Dormancy-associated protein 1 isoform 2 [Zea mays]ACG25404.1 auxin-repressed 12.5 kDa protein [Zea mays]ACG28117.1 auxin-repressed 12.5 kDa protein [Zea mays]ACG31084.1 auxin-repressed 12.5 kDa protein [Zea mays]ONM05035.1 dormancy associated1 [Zea mays]ONM05037.1 dormancy associated1 [Zea mays]